jgi:cyclic pyranopterin phosphate synthase
MLTFEEISRLVGVAVSLGWKKVRLTGGEPLVRKDCVRLVEMIARHKRSANGGARLHELVMTSNGLLLSRFANDLHQVGLDRVNVSVDTLVPKRFHRITGYDKLPEVLEGIHAAVDAGLAPVKINTVLIKGSTEDEFDDFVEMARTRQIDVRFIEFMPFAGNGWSPDKVLGSEELKGRLRASIDLVPVRCNRVRMTSEGQLRGCLLNENEIDFRIALRSGADDKALADSFRSAIALKPEEHTFHASIEEGEADGAMLGRGMYRIGG